MRINRGGQWIEQATVRHSDFFEFEKAIARLINRGYELKHRTVTPVQHSGFTYRDHGSRKLRVQTEHSKRYKALLERTITEGSTQK